MRHIIILGIIICLFSSCLEKIDPKSLTNTNWQLTELTGKTLPANAMATLNFAEDLKFSGKSFCNNYGGQAVIENKKVSLKNVFGTKMFCQETASEENAFLSALNETTSAKMVDGKLHLLKGEETILIFTKIN